MLALITGRGPLPAIVAAAQPTPPLVCALKNNEPDDLVPDIVFRIERLGWLIHDLKLRGVTDVCLCGPIHRPNISALRIEWRTLPLVPKIARAAKSGEDSALRVIVSFFEDKGLRVHGAHELAPGLLPPPGAFSSRAVPADLDVAPALGVLKEQDARDLGQACVVRDGVVIAREGRAGTDRMLEELAAPPRPKPAQAPDDPFFGTMDMIGDALDQAADWLSGPVAEARARGQGGFLFKAPKPNQDLRVDLPTIGPNTVARAAAARLDGVVIAAGGVMVLEQAQTRAALDAAGMYCWVR